MMIFEGVKQSSFSSRGNPESIRGTRKTSSPEHGVTKKTCLCISSNFLKAPFDDLGPHHRGGALQRGHLAHDFG